MSGPWMLDRNSDGDAVHLIDGCCYETPAHCAPVAVIDLADADAVQRLAVAWGMVTTAEFDDTPISVAGARMREALRSLIAPPKPAEPTGLGAVVEDAAGAYWVRHQTTGGGGWYVDGITRSYANVAAVKVLSEGIS